ncbi:hypothetical protein F5B20DRAFT_571157 [Whalleya microplaca]|nr:hypothetical protein F5B20DRAFT_571157 [Whalleya microplaca]
MRFRGSGLLVLGALRLTLCFVIALHVLVRFPSLVLCLVSTIPAWAFSLGHQLTMGQAFSGPNFEDSPAPQPVLQSAREEDVPADTTVETTKVLCKDSVLTVFPNICPAYLEEITSEHAYDADTVVSVILDKLENGQLYPTQPHSNPLKRKRDNEGQDEMEAGGEPEAVRAVREQIDKADYVLKVASPAYQDLAKKLLSHDFPLVPALTLRNLQLSHRQSLYLTYTAMDDALDNWDNANPLWKDKKTPSRPADDFSADRLSSLDMSKYSPEEQAAFAELRAARDLRAVKHAKAAAKSEEEANFASAQREGQTAECGCCFEECALNRMIRCNGETVHWFCRDCMRSQAETVIGLSKWELTCMSMDSCSAGFSANQRPLFLDKKLGTALDRIEQEAMLRMAGIENLESCPFCPYAAEYPPVEVDKEFRCDNEDCYRVSCRLCRKETHIPKTCEEVAIEEGGGDARHALEEAMSAALIRTCNKCRNPFMKEDGCNKILCTRCQTLHCYVCRKTITGYQHFNDKKRGGKDGQCPLFDSTEERHQQEVERAEKEALEKVAKENPDVVRLDNFQI